MTLKPIGIDLAQYPEELHGLLSNACIYDSSCSQEAKTIFIDKDQGYFLKSAPKGRLERQAKITKFFYDKGLSANVLLYLANDQDWILTEKIPGNDCIATKYLEHPTRLCDTLAETLVLLHSTDFTGCPITNHTQMYLAKVEGNMKSGSYDTSHFPDSYGYKSAEEAWTVVKTHGNLLQNDTLLHGDYCLPNVMLDNWKFSGFIDLDQGGVGDRHVDIFGGLWSLSFNLKTDRYRQRFIDAYGREKVNEEVLRVVAAAEVFG
ncbi:MAG: aminoglycoside 3'-phosphotransferase [Defluviitaleaceae bacterium]|nr:aminoglycoside 3'-phosphotransferase [Defluviitaleaceae bacterium]